MTIDGGAETLILSPWWVGEEVASCEYARAVNWFKVDGNFTTNLKFDAL